MALRYKLRHNLCFSCTQTQTLPSSLNYDWVKVTSARSRLVAFKMWQFDVLFKSKMIKVFHANQLESVWCKSQPVKQQNWTIFFRQAHNTWILNDAWCCWNTVCHYHIKVVKNESKLSDNYVLLIIRLKWLICIK